MIQFYYYYLICSSCNSSAALAKKHAMVLKNVSSSSTGQASRAEAAGSWLGEIEDQSVHYHPILPCYANQTHAAYMFDNLLLSMPT
jgi:hypothetical protein